MSGIHMGGLISGIDTQGIIEQLLALRTTRIDTVQAQKVDLQTDVAAWTDISGYMTTLTNSLYALYSDSVDTWNMLTATSSDTDTLTGTAGTSAIEAVYNITITDLARAHSVSSDKASVLKAGADSATDLIAESVLTVNETFTIEGVTFTMGKDEYGQTVTGTESLSSLMNKINYAATNNSFDNQVGATILDNKLVITRAATGATEIVMSEGTGTPLQDLQIFSGAATYKVANVLVDDRDASFSVNGVAITRSQNTNLTDVIENVTLNLLKDGGVSETLTVSRDTETPKNAILDFISSYNAAVSKLESYNSIDLSDPLNPAVGQLQGDFLVRSIPDALRRLATHANADMTDGNAGYTYNSLTGILNALEDIGIWTGSADPDVEGYSSANELTLIDETRLDNMLGSYFDKVEQLFKGVSGGSEDGLAESLYIYSNGVSQTLTGYIAKKIERLEGWIDDKDELIEKMFDDLDDYEQLLWADFTAMESAISRMQQDLGWLTSQLGLTE